MATPYPLAFLADGLKARDVAVDLERYEEISGNARGQQWSAELGRPLWRVTLSLADRRTKEAREIDAKIRALGTNRPFLWTDPTYDLGGRTPGSSVTVRSISPDRTQISLQGLPAGYQIKVGDRFSINHGSNWYFAEFAIEGLANAAGETGLMTVTPYPLLTLSAGATVEMAAPILQLFVPAGGHKPFVSSLGDVARNGSLDLLQKV